MDRLVTGIDPISGTVVSGAGSALVASLTPGIEMGQVIVVGMVGAILYFLKTCNWGALKSQPLKKIIGIPYRLVSPAALTAIVYYGGTDGFNPHIVDLGTPLWMLAGFMGALNFDDAFKWLKTFSSQLIKKRTGVSNEESDAE